jgi:hypothetical protein
MIHHGMLKIGDELYLVRHNMNESYEALGSGWNEIDPLNKTFKRDGRVYFCEKVEEAIVDEDVDNPII